MIDAPFTGADVRVDVIAGAVGFTRPAAAGGLGYYCLQGLAVNGAFSNDLTPIWRTRHISENDHHWSLPLIL